MATDEKLVRKLVNLAENLAKQEDVDSMVSLTEDNLHLIQEISKDPRELIFIVENLLKKTGYLDGDCLIQPSIQAMLNKLKKNDDSSFIEKLFETMASVMQKVSSMACTYTLKDQDKAYDRKYNEAYDTGIAMIVGAAAMNLAEDNGIKYDDRIATLNKCRYEDTANTIDNFVKRVNDGRTTITYMKNSKEVTEQPTQDHINRLRKGDIKDAAILAKTSNRNVFLEIIIEDGNINTSIVDNPRDNPTHTEKQSCDPA
ncbi:MAG: hypothetical protein KAJ40_01920 [Alphaproteobacteria bacterium]|nr:hypothetical protein [Alphaproteobacteria bacterium]